MRPASSASRYCSRMRSAVAISCSDQPIRSRAARKSAPARGASGSRSPASIADDIMLRLSASLDLRSFSTGARPRELVVSQRPYTASVRLRSRIVFAASGADKSLILDHSVRPAGHVRAPRPRSVRADWRPPRCCGGSAVSTGRNAPRSSSASIALIGRMPEADIDRLVKPSPTSAIASSGRDAASPHSDTGTPAPPLAAPAATKRCSSRLSTGCDRRS